MNIIGIHYGHDSNVTYVKNGKCVFAISEERLSRIKFDTSWPQKSLDFIINNYNLNSEKIDFVTVVGSSKQEETSGGSLIKIYKKFGLKINFLIKVLSPIVNVLDNLFSFLSIRKKLAIKHLKKKLDKIGISENKIIFLDHHFCHAIGSFHASEFDSSLIITCDGKGDDSSHKSFIGKKNEKGQKEIKLISKSKDIDSIGFFYSAITEFLGFKALRHEGKITGLAAYGTKDYEKINSPVVLSSNGLKLQNSLIKNYEIKLKFYFYFKFLLLDYKFFFKNLLNNSAMELRYYQLLLRKFLEKNFKDQSKENIARYAQQELENKINNLISNTIKLEDNKNICLSGGVFANVKLNQTIYEKTKKNIFVMPGMDDGGLSLGAALHIYEIKSGLPAQEDFEHIYFGPEYSEEQILADIKKYNFNYQKFDFIEKKIATTLHDGKIVGRFNGSMEWGPRALGNRSILAVSKNKNINKTLNDRLNRTEFMPFAPIILNENASEYFKNYETKIKCAEFMTMTFGVKEDKIKLIPAVVHVDNTARPQCVKKEKNKSLHNILVEYQKLSGVPVLINTSFNLHEEPIVCSPNDALRAFQQGAVDFLALGNFWVSKKVEL